MRFRALRAVHVLFAIVLAIAMILIAVIVLRPTVSRARETPPREDMPSYAFSGRRPYSCARPVASALTVDEGRNPEGHWNRTNFA